MRCESRELLNPELILNEHAGGARQDDQQKLNLRLVIADDVDWLARSMQGRNFQASYFPKRASSFFPYAFCSSPGHTQMTSWPHRLIDIAQEVPRTRVLVTKGFKRP